MGQKESGKVCATCGRQTLHRQARPNHVLHAIITIFSCCTWAVVWVILTMRADEGPWLCTTCGSKFEAQ